MFGFLSFSDLGETILGGINNIPLDIDLVVGIPRSGMIPAYMIGLYRNVSVLDLPSFLADAPASKGFRPLGTALDTALQARSILLVDDSISTGRALRQAVGKIESIGYAGRVTTCAIVVEHSRRGLVDICFREMPHPRMFEWNAFHNVLVEDACFDMDGILCVDPKPEDNDDGPRYRRFLQTAQVRFRPTHKIGNIVSARLEKYRGLTEQWLADNGISYGGLHLIDLPTAAERVRLKAHCPHKAKVYRESGAAIFFESEGEQAREIARLSSKPVLCTDEMRLYLPGMSAKSAVKQFRWHFAKPIGRARAKARSLAGSMGITIPRL